MRKWLLALCVVVATANVAWADKYVRAGGNNGNSGNDWTNAYQTLATCETNTPRGETCWVGNGSVGGATLDTAASGTAVITIQKATVTSHGTDTGWSATYASQATFGDILIDSDYWTFDGAFRDENDWADQTAYGFFITGAFHTFADAQVRCGDNITLRYTAINANDGADAVKASCFTGAATTNFTAYRNYFYNADGGFATAHMTVVDGCTFEENQFGASQAKEAIRGQGSFKNCVIARNVFRQACLHHPTEGGCTCHIAIWDGSANAFDNNEIYGNVIDDRGNTGSDGPSSSCSILVGGDGGSWAGSPANNTLVFNNTVVGVVNTTPHILVNGGTGNVCRNNLFYDNTGSPSVTCSTASHNGSGDEASDPFVSYATGDFHLASASSGSSTGSPSGNATDIDNVTRGGDGTWDRGAFEFGTGVRRVPFIRRDN